MHALYVFPPNFTLNPPVSCLSGPPMRPAGSPQGTIAAEQEKHFNCVPEAQASTCCIPNKRCPLPSGHRLYNNDEPPAASSLSGIFSEASLLSFCSLHGQHRRHTTARMNTLAFLSSCTGLQSSLTKPREKWQKVKSTLR